MTQRPADQLRPISIERHYLRTCPGSVLYRSGGTTVLCTASVLNEVPPFLVGKGKGWITAEYEMLPAATTPRRRRDRSGKVDGRTTEIQRLIGRSLRAVADLSALGERTLAIDCDVLEADGGTRTAAISGSLVALVDALSSLVYDVPDPMKYVLRDSIAAVSVGIVNGVPTLDLDYPLDVAAEVDMNVVMTGAGRFVEVQGTGEEATFGDDELAALLSLAKKGIREIREKQKAALGDVWPWA